MLREDLGVLEQLAKELRVEYISGFEYVSYTSTVEKMHYIHFTENDISMYDYNKAMEHLKAIEKYVYASPLQKACIDVRKDVAAGKQYIPSVMQAACRHYVKMNVILAALKHKKDLNPSHQESLKFKRAKKPKPTYVELIEELDDETR
jgi:hypothetical protein